MAHAAVDTHDGEATVLEASLARARAVLARADREADGPGLMNEIDAVRVGLGRVGAEAEHGVQIQLNDLQRVADASQWAEPDPIHEQRLDRMAWLIAQESERARLVGRGGPSAPRAVAALKAVLDDATLATKGLASRLRKECLGLRCMSRAPTRESLSRRQYEMVLWTRNIPVVGRDLTIFPEGDAMPVIEAVLPVELANDQDGRLALENAIDAEVEAWDPDLVGWTAIQWRDADDAA